MRAERAVESLVKSLAGDESLGARVVLDALSVPMRTVSDNAGYEGYVSLRKVRAAKKTEGFDATSGEVVDMFEAGIVDPTKVARSALQNAASVACLLVSTDALIANLPEKEEDHDHDHGEY